MTSIFQLSEYLDLPTFYGVNNENIQLIQCLYPNIKIVARGVVVKIEGQKDEIEKLTRLLKILDDFCLRTNQLTEQNIRQLTHGELPLEKRQEDLILHGVSGKSIVARTPNQRKLVEALNKNDIVFAVGPAGSGKTYTAIALAVRMLKNKEKRKIILSRPAVEAGEKLGFLPGDMKEKIDPYLQPLYDALEDMIPPMKLKEWIENGTIQIAPLAFMRGRTLSDSVVILDEAQNTTPQQIKMFLTRMGLNAKIIITGDITQIDLPKNQHSGLIEALRILEKIKGIEKVFFDKKDIVRHRLVQKIVEAYDKYQHKNKTN